MFEIEINGEKRKADVSCITPYIYEQEFGGDMVADLYGRIDDKTSGFLEINKKGAIVAVDYTKVSWNAVLKALWAALRTADKTIPGYKLWAEDAAGLNAADARGYLLDAVEDCFFRTEPSGEEADEDEKQETDGE